MTVDQLHKWLAAHQAQPTDNRSGGVKVAEMAKVLGWQN